jgi:hypothetical protein
MVNVLPTMIKTRLTYRLGVFTRNLWTLLVIIKNHALRDMLALQAVRLSMDAIKRVSLSGTPLITPNQYSLEASLDQRLAKI